MHVSKWDLWKNTNELIQNLQWKKILRQLREKDRDSNQWKKVRERTDIVGKVIYSMENKLQGFENIWNTFLECLWKTKQTTGGKSH